MLRSLVGSEMCIRDRSTTEPGTGRLIGRTVERCWCCNPVFSVYGPQGEHRFDLRPPSNCLGCGRCGCSWCSESTRLGCPGTEVCCRVSHLPLYICPPGSRAQHGDEALDATRCAASGGPDDKRGDLASASVPWAATIVAHEVGEIPDLRGTAGKAQVYRRFDHRLQDPSQTVVDLPDGASTDDALGLLGAGIMLDRSFFTWANWRWSGVPE
eukprot:TRINITY_DN4085_c0_g1_i9.p1 TRINITY_DN4085_c0_g1~~TRINITY_DN4085_c0_g1_i9.p1  ORF type:complete len:212 (-),score=19.57 TRINITY_DN4085_c0_g1_i9:368-1003(-)